ncbi:MULTISPECIES: hypothetical protein [Kitasatospora]|uniref:Uncharacterized protein n=1 Tax=Kitasatospora cystarginea TaxID=58350 RepID=A0ABN3E9U1_9ACTN
MTRLRAGLLAVGFATATFALTTSPAQAAPGDVTNVCASTLTPSGFVDVQWWTSAGCGSTTSPNMKQIKQLTGLPVGTVVNACASTYPPAGWVQVSTFFSSGCGYSPVPSFNNNAWQLKRVS